MGYYTHGWREQPDYSTTGKSAREIAEAGGPGYGALLAGPRRETPEPGSRTPGTGYGAASRSGRRDYGEAVVQTGAALLGQTPVPGLVVRGFFGVIKSIFTLDFH